MRKLHVSFFTLLIIAWLAFPAMTSAQATEGSVVRAIVFFSPTCPHCHKVITEVLIPMVSDYGSGQLKIMGIDTSQPGGGQLFQAAIERYQIPSQRQGVPMLVIGDVVLVGSVEIPELFPGLVEEGLNSGGVDWPDIPGIEAIIPPEAQGQPSPSPEPPPTAMSEHTSTPESRTTSTPTTTDGPTQIPIPTAAGTPPALALDDELPLAEPQEPPSDPVGFTLAGVVMAGMLAATGYVVWRVIHTPQRLFQITRNPATTAQTWAIPILALLGLGVASYLAYVEINQLEAVCGPIGKCNIVQSSPYARIVGIPIAVLGMLDYVTIGVLWAGKKYPDDQWANLSAWGLVVLTLFGTLFSIYLTSLELFVIHAICAWCISSAIISTLVMMLSVIPVVGRQS